MKKLIFIILLGIIIGCEPTPQDIINKQRIERIEVGKKLDSVQNYILLEQNSKYKKYFLQYPSLSHPYNGYYITTDESDTILSIYNKIGE